MSTTRHVSKSCRLDFLKSSTSNDYFSLADERVTDVSVDTGTSTRKKDVHSVHAT